MGKANPEVSIPGAPAAAASQEAPAQAAPGAVDPRDAEIAALRAQLAAADPSTALIMEADGPNTRRHRAESKHLHLTSVELRAKIDAGDVKLTDHHVLCKDGWYVNLAANAHANG